MNRSMGEKIFFYKTPGSHPEEKFGLEATDPTPKRNLIRERRIPPQREISSGSDPDPTPKRNLVKEPWIPPRRKFRVGKQNGEKKVKLTSTKKS